MRTWIYTSVTEEIHNLAMEPEQMALDIWTRIRDHFQANKSTRAVYLNSRFHSMIQGDLTIDEYFQQLKTMADELRDVGHKMSDLALVLNALRGLSPRFSTQADIITFTFTDPLPSFAKTRSLLQTAEMKKTNAAHQQAASALVTMTGSCNDPKSGDTCGTPPTSGGCGRGHGSNSQGRGGYNNQGRGGSAPQSGRASTGPSLQRALGLHDSLGALTQGMRARLPHARVVPQLWHPRLSPCTCPAQAHTTSALIAALNAMQSPPPGGWVMDNGATSHMASDDGILHSSFPLYPPPRSSWGMVLLSLSLVLVTPPSLLLHILFVFTIFSWCHPLIRILCPFVSLLVKILVLSNLTLLVSL